MGGMKPSKAKKGRTLAEQQADLGKLGKYLSASDVGGNARERTKVSKQRQASLKDAFWTQRGGGQGKASPMKPNRPYSSPTGTWNVSARKKSGK